MEQRLADVLVAVARERAQVGLESVHLLDARTKAVMLELLGHLACSCVQPLPVGIEQEHVAREVAEADDARAGLGHRVVRVLRHGHRVLVGEGDRAEVERLFEEPQQPVPLLEPVSPVNPQRSFGTGRIQEDEPCRPAILHR